MSTNTGTRKYISIDFVGDSIIERWDLGDYFYNWHTQNFGKSGAGIDYLELLHGRFTSRTIVVNIGINDNQYFSGPQSKAYAERYINAIRGLGAEKVYLFAVLPCAFKSNGEIEAFNAAIREQTKPFGDIVYINAFNEFISEGGIRRRLYCDGLHLSPSGYQLLTEILTPIIEGYSG